MIDFDELEIDESPSSGELADARLVPTIELPIVNEEACADQVIRIVAKHKHLYQRAGALVRITKDAKVPRGLKQNNGLPGIRELTAHSVREMIASHFHFTKKGKHGEPVAASCPEWLKNAIHARGEWQEIRPLTGIVTWPAMRTDGTFLSKPGYDDDTGLFYIGPEISYPECPSLAEAKAAAEFLMEPVAEFPFVNDSHQAAWFCLPLTLMIRYAIDCTPVWIFDAPTPGTGKTFLAELGVRMITGTSMAAMAPSEDPEEDRKRITALAMNGDVVCLVDNVVGAFGNAAFDAAVTKEDWSDRVLGASRTVRLPMRIVWLVSGNNVMIKGDMQRRVLHCRLDPQVERPEERKFKKSQGELLEHVLDHRAEYLRACMTVLRYTIAADRPKMKHWGSFELWGRYARQAAVHCGLTDPIETRDAFRKASDTTHEARITFLRELYRMLMLTDEHEMTAKRLHGLVVSSEDAKEAASELAKCAAKDLTSQRLGYVLRALRGRVAAGLMLDSRENRENTCVWSVKRSE